VASYAWNFGDGGTSTLAKPTHAFTAGGSYQVTLTVTDDKGATDSVTKSVSVTAPNVKPTAAFTSSATGLSVDFDGSGSSDSDGSVASYAWNFGDGGTSTLAKPTHAFTAAGSYQVTLTVTDDRGATDAVTKTVAVSAVVDPAFAKDAFARTVSNGLGSADTGGAWSLVSSSSNFGVSAGAARLKLTSAGASPLAFLPGVSSSDTDLRTVASLDKDNGAAGDMSVGVIPRGGYTDGYRARVKVATGGKVTVTLSRVVAKAETAMKSVSTTLTYTAGDKLQIRAQAFGSSPTTVRVKVWKDGTAEPTAWTNTVTDSTAGLQGAGGVGVFANLASSSTVAPVVASFFGLDARPTTP
jgi:PKD repeat protein